MQQVLDISAVTWTSISLAEGNLCLEAWGHRMGPMSRPCLADVGAHALRHNGEPVAVAMTAGLVRHTVAGVPWMNRENTVELARLCACRPGLCRVALRLWREFTWPLFGREYAMSYQDADLHTGNTYRFDGWQRLAYAPGKGTDPRSGRKGRNKWVWVWPPRKHTDNGIAPNPQADGPQVPSGESLGATQESGG